MQVPKLGSTIQLTGNVGGGGVEGTIGILADYGTENNSPSDFSVIIEVCDKNGSIGWLGSRAKAVFLRERLDKDKRYLFTHGNHVVIGGPPICLK